MKKTDVRQIFCQTSVFYILVMSNRQNLFCACFSREECLIEQQVNGSYTRQQSPPENKTRGICALK